MLYTFALIVLLLVVICSGSLVAFLFLNCWPSCPVCSQIQTSGDARMFLAVKKASKGRKRNAEVTVDCTNVTFHDEGNFFEWCVFEVEVLLNLNGVFFNYQSIYPLTYMVS